MFSAMVDKYCIPGDDLTKQKERCSHTDKQNKKKIAATTIEVIEQHA